MKSAHEARQGVEAEVTSEVTELAESWFERPQRALSSRPPAPPSRPPPSGEPLGDDLADAWFR